MELYKQYKKIVDSLKPIEIAWFTTFNLDVELTERYLLSPLVDRDPKELKTAEDYEAMNIDLTNLDIKIWYDYRALNTSSPKRTTVSLLSINPQIFFNANSADTVFHPKIIFIKGKNDAYLICGSANLSIAAWSMNQEAVLVKKITCQHNADQVINFFETLFSKSELNPDVFSSLKSWKNTLSKQQSGWNFITTIQHTQSIFDYIGKGTLTIWSPYFSKDISGLLDNLKSKGYNKINLVPNISESGSVRILPKELEIIRKNESVQVCKMKNNESSYGNISSLRHAKVWLTEKLIAVGSWNCSYRATGLNLPLSERNIEAGIIASIKETDFRALNDKVETIDTQLITGTSELEMENEWDQVLNPFTLDCKITANWKTHTYHLITEAKEGFTVSLPDKPGEKISLSNVNNHSFQHHIKRVLKDKTYTVYNANGQVVYFGFLIEQELHMRQAYGYSTLFDLFESLLSNPLGETARRQCRYTLSDDPFDELINVDKLYKGNESYYMMFVAFQELNDAINENKDKPNKLYDIGFRLPSSLINISALVNESLELLNKEANPVELLYHYFLSAELNYSIDYFNALTGYDIKTINNQELINQLNPSAQDLKFIKLLQQEFGYSHV